jgi:opacity protein-like surface antigen
MLFHMNKHISLRAAAAALAATLALAAASPAFAQPGSRDYGRVDGGPPLFSGHAGDDEFRYGDHDRDRDDWRRRKPDFQQVQKDCSIAGIRKAWDQGYYSAQYHDGPRLVEGRYGWEVRGKMRLHNRKGYSYVDTYCEIGRNNNVRIDFGRR